MAAWGYAFYYVNWIYVIIIFLAEGQVDRKSWNKLSRSKLGKYKSCVGKPEPDNSQSTFSADYTSMSFSKAIRYA